MIRNSTLDILKAIGILLVIVGHNVTGIMGTYIYSFHMPLFFLLSGYLYKERSVLKSISHDYNRIVLPYLCYYIIVNVIDYIYNGITCDILIQDIIKISWASFGRIDVFGHHVQGVLYLWFLPALFICKNVFNAIYLAWKPLTKNNYYVFLFVCLFVCWIAGLTIHHKLFPLPFAITTGLNALGYYTIGFLIKIFMKDTSYIDEIKWYYKLLALAVWIVFGKYALNGMGTCEYKFIPLDYIVGIAGTMVFYYVAQIINKNMKGIAEGLAILGKYTISILIIHQFIANFIWHIKFELNNFLVILITCLVAAIYVTVVYNVKIRLAR